jgi:hypothetical protein
VGQERVTQMDSLAEKYQGLPLPQRRNSPTDHAPQVACVQMDGGRIQIRERNASPQGKENQSKIHWRETLVGCLLRMSSKEHTEDPCPTIPQTFVDPQRMRDLSREIKGFSATSESDEKAESPPLDSPLDRSDKPKVLVRSVIATRKGIDAFGKRLIAAAYQRGFSKAVRKAFVADGSATNWSVYAEHFSDYTAILDFTHAICYVWAAAMAGRSFAQAWSIYIHWAQLLWSGQVTALIAAVEARHHELGIPGDGEESSPAGIVATTLRYLTNQQTRMKYNEYRIAGLPITSSHIESTIKQINRRVKGTEKFWDRGAEPILQLAADHISETNDLERFWQKRHAQLSPMRCYRTAA